MSEQKPEMRKERMKEAEVEEQRKEMIENVTQSLFVVENGGNLLLFRAEDRK